MTNDFSYYLRKYLTEYLPREKGFNTNTIDTYRYTFILLLEYLKTIGIKAEKLTVGDITKEIIVQFLSYLEDNRNNSAVTINSRLAALHSFFRYLQYEYPDYSDEYIKILTIPFKKIKRKQRGYLTIEEMTLLLKEIDISNNDGQRDYMMILLMYETAVRVSELINVRFVDFRLSKPYSLQVLGKGNKQRYIPVSDAFILKLKEYIHHPMNQKKIETDYLFYNHSHQQLTRTGVGYILNKYVEKAKNNNPHLFKTKISPHTLRHTKAMHLLQDDVNLIYIRDILGHESIQTTEIYARTDSARMRQAIEKSYKSLSSESESIWQNDSILDWLKQFY